MEDKKITTNISHQLEKRTLEVLLRELREQKKWSYYDVIQELNKLGITVDTKKIRKWEVGLEYPDLDTLYKLSELYFFPVEKLMLAKNNSYEEGINGIHLTFIRWFCYITGLTLKIGYVFFYFVIACALIISFLYFLNQLSLVDKSKI